MLFKPDTNNYFWQLLQKNQFKVNDIVKFGSVRSWKGNVGVDNRVKKMKFVMRLRKNQCLNGEGDAIGRSTPSFKKNILEYTWLFLMGCLGLVFRIFFLILLN